MKLKDVEKFLSTASRDEARETRRLAHRRYISFNAEPKPKLVKYNAWDMNMASDMELAILSNFPRFKKKSKKELEKWAEDFRKIRELDGRDEQEIIEVLGWALKNDFWKKNILSPGKFRIKFEQLMANAQGGGSLI